MSYLLPLVDADTKLLPQPSIDALAGVLPFASDADVAAVSAVADQAATTAAAAVPSANIDPVMTAVATDQDSAFYAAIAAQISATEPPADWFTALFVPPESSDFPTVTVSPVSTIAGGTLIRETRVAPSGDVDLAGDTHFLYDGMLELPANSASPETFASPPLLPGGESQAAHYQLRIHTLTDEPITEHKLRVASTSMGFRIKVNGQWVTLELDRVSGLTAGGTVYVRIAFPVRRMRLVTYEDAGSGTAFGGVVVPVGGTLTRPVLTGPKFADLGDSYSGGSGAPPEGANRMEVWSNLVARLMGASSFINFGVGGTGWVATDTPFITRADAIAQYNPDILGIMGSRNDPSNAAAAITAAVSTLLDRFKTTPQIYVTGPSTSGFTVQNDAVKAGTLASGRTFLDGIAEQWITSADLGPDNTHPTFAGHQKIARGFYQAMRANPDVPPSPPTPPATLLFEDFNKPDSTSSWGTPETGSIWAKFGTLTPVINGGKAGVSAVTGSAYLFATPVGGDGSGRAVHRVKIGVAGVQKKAAACFNFSGVGTTAMVRVQGDSAGSGNWKVFVSNVAVPVVATIPQADGDEIIFTRTLDDTITITINGALLYTGPELTLGTNRRIGALFNGNMLDVGWEEFEVTALS